MSDQDILDLINGAGTEDLRTAAPVLEVIQKGSPQVDATHKDYKTKCIDGAVPGDIILTSTNTIVKKAKDKKAELEFTLLAIGKCYVEFKPKTEGGGFVAINPLSVVSKREYRKGDGTEKGKYREFLGKNELQYTATLFGTILIDGVKTKVMVRLKSTQLRKLRELEKMVASFRWDGVKQVPPMFARKWLVSLFFVYVGFSRENLGYGRAVDSVLFAEFLRSAAHPAAGVPRQGVVFRQQGVHFPPGQQPQRHAARFSMSAMSFAASTCGEGSLAKSTDTSARMAMSAPVVSTSENTTFTASGCPGSWCQLREVMAFIFGRSLKNSSRTFTVAIREATSASSAAFSRWRSSASMDSI